jgi:integrase
MDISSHHPGQGEPKLLDRVRSELRKRHYSPRTEEAYLSWIARFIRFHRMRHPAEMARSEVEAFLSSLTVDRNVAASTQNQALSALFPLYRDVPGTGLSWLDDVVRAKKPKHLPVVLTRMEIQAVFGNLYGQNGIAAVLMFGTGLRLLETLRLRVKDIDFGDRQITVRQGKGSKDRVTVLPGAVENRLKLHLDEAKIRHEKDLKEGGGCITLSLIESCNHNLSPDRGNRWPLPQPITSPTDPLPFNRYDFKGDSLPHKKSGFHKNITSNKDFLVILC